MATVRHVTTNAAANTAVSLPVDCGQVEVVNRSANEVYFSTDGNVLTGVGNNNNHVLPAVIGASLIVDNETPQATRATACVVNVWTTTASAISVRAL